MLKRLNNFILVLALVLAVKADSMRDIINESDHSNGDTSDAGRTFAEICARNGFQYEEH